jgi:hypothetical protein
VDSSRKTGEARASTNGTVCSSGPVKVGATGACHCSVPAGAGRGGGCGGGQHWLHPLAESDVPSAAGKQMRQEIHEQLSFFCWPVEPKQVCGAAAAHLSTTSPSPSCAASTVMKSRPLGPTSSRPLSRNLCVCGGGGCGGGHAGCQCKHIQCRGVAAVAHAQGRGIHEHACTYRHGH